jgi:glycyl-tRNA synthetase beta chain
MTSRNLLVELFVEELPPKSLDKLGQAFADKILNGLIKYQLTLCVLEGVEIFASPRRLGVFIPAVLDRAPDRTESIKLMPVTVGLDADGQPTAALLKKLASLGADKSAVPQLKRALDGKTEALFFDSVVRGAMLAEALQIALNEALAQLPIAKVMTYQLADGWSSVNFVRPAHGLVALHGSEVVPVSVLGLTAGRETQGHRFEASVSPLVLNNADSYAQQLQTEGAVIAHYAVRRLNIIRQLRGLAQQLNSRLEVEPVAGLTDAEAEAVLEDDCLVQEVTALVERPNALVGQFEAEYLQVPQECLILTMKANQKYFPLLDASGRLTNKFLIVSNISPEDASLVIRGNERVVRPRLADAKFFFDQDRKKTLAARVEGLDKVVYHNKLGSQGDRVKRVQAIARAIAQKLGDDALAMQADQAAGLAKADLLTDMVGEFPELQGIMGRYYAQHDGLGDDIAYAIEDHYKPRFAGDELPRNEVGICVALADKLETLVGMFGIGQIPTGDKDPFALRRHALGIVRMLIEKELPLRLNDLTNTAFAAFPKGLLGDAHTAMNTFIFERLGGLMREQGYTTAEVTAVLCMRPVQIYLVPQQLKAVRTFSALPEATALAAANKRVGNILKKFEDEVSNKVNEELLAEPAERVLHQTLSKISPAADAAHAAGDYTASLQVLAALRDPIDAFFDNVMVHAEDAALRANRLALLWLLKQAMNRVADLSKLAN